MADEPSTCHVTVTWPPHISTNERKQMSKKVTVVVPYGKPPRVFTDRRSGADVLRNAPAGEPNKENLGKFVEYRIDDVITWDGTIQEVDVED